VYTCNLNVDCSLSRHDIYMYVHTHTEQKDEQYHLDCIAAFFLQRSFDEPLQEDRDERENFFRKIDSIKDPKVLATQVFPHLITCVVSFI